MSVTGSTTIAIGYVLKLPIMLFSTAPKSSLSVILKIMGNFSVVANVKFSIKLLNTHNHMGNTV